MAHGPAHERAHLPGSVKWAITTTVVVTLASYAISYVALVGLGELAGLDWPLPLVYPVTIDGLLTTGLVAAIALRAARRRARFYTWVLIGGATLVSLAGNAAHSLAHTAGQPLIVRVLLALVSAVPAGTLAASLHLLVIIWRHAERPGERAPERTVEADSEPDERVEPEPIEHPREQRSLPKPRRSRPRSTQATIDDAERYLSAQRALGEDPLTISAAKLRRELAKEGLITSRPTAQRWVRELRSAMHREERAA